VSTDKTGKGLQVIIADHPPILTRLQALTAAEQRLSVSFVHHQEESMVSSVKSDSTIGSRSTKKIGLLKSIERNILALFKLGRIESIAKNAGGQVQLAMTRIDQIAKDLERVAHDVGKLAGNVDELAGDVDEKIEAHGNSIRSKIGDVLLVANEQSGRSSAYHAEAARAFSDLSHRLDALTIKAISGPSHVDDGSGLAKTQESLIGNAGKDTEGFSAFMDFFYHRLENRLRGSRLEIKNRLRNYLPDVKAAIGRTGMKTALDLGCGRGEWLELLREEGIAAKGVDLNAPQIAEAKGVGLDVENRDLLQVLQEAEGNSISVITAHHVVEHLDFPQVAWIAREAIRVLAPGGILIFETPNVRNMIVGSTSFHNDPTHIKPITEPVLQVLFDAVGFFPVEVRHLHPHEKLAQYLDKPTFDPELAYLLFGAQDVAVIGRKIVE